MHSCYVIGIGGGTGSGKSTLAKELQRQLADEGSVLISMDDYYLDQSTVPLERRVQMNYDSPDSLEISLLVKHLKALKAGKGVDKPKYDFSTHTRALKTEKIKPVQWVIIEGILTLHYLELLAVFDLTIYVDTAADIRFVRRLSRDTKERGRTMDSVIDQYMATVRPMHEQFVEPTKSNADFIVSGERDFETTVKHILGSIGTRLNRDIKFKPLQSS